MGRRPLVFAVALALVFVNFPLGEKATALPSPSVVISQVYGGGGNSGAPYANDFVELFNRGTAAVSLAGWSIQYTSATGTGLFGANSGLLTPLSGSLSPGQYFLIQEASQAAVGAPLPAADVVDATPIAMAAGAGKVALVNTTTALACNGGSTTCSTAALATIVDLIGYGNANFFEGAAAAPTLSSTTAAFRNVGGCVDTDNNGADFAAAAPAPRNTAAPLNVCGTTPTVTSTSPANGATSVALSANVTITFNKAVNVSGSWFAISCLASGSHTASQSGGPTSFTLDPSTDFVLGETCTVTIFATQVADQEVPPHGMSSDYVFSFSTSPLPARIHDIQGAAHISPLSGRTVTGVPGIVTAKRGNGFYMQDPSPDADRATSEGIFVFTSSAPSSVSVQDSVAVAGKVQEFRPGSSSSSNLTTTEIAAPTITVVTHANPLPSAIVIGDPSSTPPTSTIEDDAAGDVETGGTFDPAYDGIDFWESLEGMRLELHDPIAVGPTNVFGETPVVVAGASVRTPRGGVIVRPTDFNPERLVLDDLITSGLPVVNVGDTYVGSVVGVLDYNFGNFALELTSMPTVASGGIAPETAAVPGAGELTVATFNVENLDPTDPQSKFDALAALIVNNLRAPDVIAVEEVQDNNGAANDSVVAANLTLDKLVAAIVAAGGPAYGWREIDPVDDQDGGEPGGNIRQALLIKPRPGLTFVDRPGGGAMINTTVVGTASGPVLSYSPGRVKPADAAFTSSRKPLAGEFMFNGVRLFIVANHFNSKGGDQPLMGRLQPPTRSSEVQRHQQAAIVRDFVASILALDPAANVVVAGDLNDFEFSDTASILKGAPLTDLIETLPANERYTYVFEGNSQTLDQILVSNALAGSVRSFDVVHVNAEFAVQASDHDPQVARLFLHVTASALCDLTRTFVIDPGVASSLCAKLDAVDASGARGNSKARSNQIAAYINEVNAQRGKTVDDAQADELIALAGGL